MKLLCRLTSKRKDGKIEFMEVIKLKQTNDLFHDDRRENVYDPGLGCFVSRGSEIKQK